MCQHITPNSRVLVAVTIRPRTDEDLAESIEVLKRVHAKDGYPVGVDGKYLPFLHGELIEHSWVAEVCDKVAGHVVISKATDADVAVALWKQLHPDMKNIAVMERLFVDPGARGVGVAAQLIATAMAQGERLNVRLLLFALAKDKNASALYRRLGWTHFGTTAYRYSGGQEMEALCFASPASLE